MANVTDAPAKRVVTETRIPLGMPEQNLAVPPIEGYVQQWFLDSPNNLARALRGGWEFVEREEVEITSKNVTVGPLADGNTDLGNRVSVYGATDERGNEQRLYLMKLRNEYKAEDDKLEAERNMRPVQAVMGGRIGVESEAPGDAQHRYLKHGGTPPSFKSAYKG